MVDGRVLLVASYKPVLIVRVYSFECDSLLFDVLEIN